MKEKRLRNIEVILYTGEKVEELINTCQDKGINYAIIYHNQDTFDDGTKKECHYHCQLYTEDAKTISAWSKIISIEENYIQEIKSKKKAIQYLIHLNNKEKYQYNKDDIISNFDIDIYFKDKNEGLQIKEIIEYIESVKFTITNKEIIDYILSNNLWGVYRRSYSIIKDLVIEHNTIYRKYGLANKK